MNGKMNGAACFAVGFSNSRQNLRRRLEFRLENTRKLPELQAKPQAPPGISPGKHPKIAQTPGKTSGAAWNSARKMRIWREQYIRSVRPLRRHAPPQENHSKYMRAIKGFTHICRRICDKITLTNFSGGTAYGT